MFLKFAFENHISAWYFNVNPSPQNSGPEFNTLVGSKVQLLRIAIVGPDPIGFFCPKHLGDRVRLHCVPAGGR